CSLCVRRCVWWCCFFFQAEDGIRDRNVTGVQTCALPILNIMWDVPLVSGVELAIILVITVAASISVASGLDRGIKILSNINIAAAIVLMVFVLLMGPTLTLLRHTVESFGNYGAALPEMMFWTDSFAENPGWQG